MSNPSTIRGPGRQSLVDTLVRHGLTEPAARAVVQFGEELLDQMAREADPDRQREHAGMVDARTGERLGPITAGTRRGVGFADQIQAAQASGVTSAIAVHTHPGSSSFSEADAAAFDQAPLVTLLAVAGADGTWYVLSLEPGTPPPTEDEIEERYNDVLDHLEPAYHALVYAGSLTEKRAWRDLTHEIWDVIAPGLGLRYHRITPGEDGC